MTWLKIESSVPRNRKFLKAGPAASWLWVCGIAYCQEGLTDGYIPREALPTLGVVKDADRLATKLVISGLWDACEEGGWRVHDYLHYNRSAAEVAEIRASRAAGGKLGGRPNKPSEKPSDSTEGLPDKTLPLTFPANPVNPSTATATGSATASASLTDQKELRTAAKTPRALALEPNDDGNFAVIQKIAVGLLSLQSFPDEADFSEAVKSNCAKEGIAYGPPVVPGDVVARACASATEIRRLKAKVSA